MSQILHTKEIGNEIRLLIWNNLKVTLSLKVCQLGTVEFYETAGELDDIIPAVFVKPSPGSTIAIRTMDLRYTITYSYRIIFVKRFASADNVVEDKIDAINDIAELLFDNTKLSNLTLSNAEVEKQVPVSVEDDPVEEGFLALLSGNYVASVVNTQVVTHTSAP